MNRVALKFCCAYTVFFILLVGLGYSGDVKSQAVASGLAVFPILLPLAYSGLINLIPGDSWMNSVWFFFPLCLVAVYFIGWAVSGISHLLRRLFVRQPPAPVGDDPPGWHPR